MILSKYITTHSNNHAAGRFVLGNSVNRGQRRKRSRRFNLIPVDSNHKPPSLRDLVYYENSPNYCERDNSIGFKGTRGRECNATSIGVDGCDLMCCDRGYRSVSYMAQERCNCIFHWCCKVTCDICTKTKIRYMCL
ncbi:hypothetical protein NP493_481g01037 [Ridgeia piscesae]|uniref:Protein Wnt n=1 Tax=Ridgeia piscesae TaxID=27915 RepID=A0AAD9KYF6_RIDPI|nr:hypothetical protein NP493_481g01037 [Ridgeia piscesae]